MTDEERPVHVDINVTTGAVTHVAVTDDEWDAMRQAEAAAQRAEQQEAEADRLLREAVLSHPDPVVQALAVKAGLVGNL